MNPVGPAQPYRLAARQALRELYPEECPSPHEVEVTALTLFERSLLQAPAASPEPPPVAPQKLAADALYTGALAALAGCPGLSARALEVLGDFHPELLWRGEGSAGATSIRTLGDFPAAVRASRAAGGRTELECGGFPVELSGDLLPCERANVHAALQEIVGKTQTKALHLVKSVHLRPWLAEGLDSAGNPMFGLDGLAASYRQVQMLNATARDPQQCREVLFHELGHELDRILSDGSTYFRSQQSDTPFGKGECVSDYARQSCAEDFAETHARLILEWDGIRSCPDLFVHARGEVGQKLAWIMERGYREPVPPPSPRWQAMLEELDRSPFATRGELDQTVRELVASWPTPLDERGAWVLDRLGVPNSLQNP